MDVSTTHRVDASEPDARGQYEYRYEYDIYRFSSGDTALVARSYAHEPDEAHFLRLEQNGKQRLLTDADLRLPLFAEAVAYLKNHGKARLDWLSGRGNGYEEVRLET
jgi:hypothetical protein